MGNILLSDALPKCRPHYYEANSLIKTTLDSNEVLDNFDCQKKRDTPDPITLYGPAMAQPVEFIFTYLTCIYMICMT